METTDGAPHRARTRTNGMLTRREMLALMGLAGVSAALPRRAWAWSSLAPAPLRVDGARLNASLTTLSQFGRNPQGGVTRLAYSDADKQAREWVLGLMRASGLRTEIDAAGNIIGRRPGADAARHPLELVIFQNEEGGVAGSRAMIGELTDKDLALTARSGKTIGAGIAFIGGDPQRLASARRNAGDIAAYLELHIEQGGILEETKTDIGIVEGIVGLFWWDVTIDGVANHAGTTPMNRRHDAMLAAARFTIMVNRVVTSKPGRQVGTVGRISALPGAPNVIPGKVVLSLELRDLDEAKIHALFDEISAESKRIGEENGTTFSFTPTNVNHPAPTDPRMRAAIETSARELGLTTRTMPSGAGHDAQEMARIGPAGMIFVPSVNGVSHAPAELTRPADIENGANVLLRTLLRIDAELA
jgi:N-carbamoyl-L-amino-acid hydrolase